MTEPHETAERSHRRWVSPAFANAVAQQSLFSPEKLRGVFAKATDARGRAQTAVVELPGQPQRLHLRSVRHGGLLGALWRGTLWGAERPMMELAANQKLLAAGTPVPEPALVVCWRVLGPFFRAVVGTVHVEHSIDGVALLDDSPSNERILRAASAAGRATRRFHDAGGRHADLHVKNLLFREHDASTEAWIIDLDKARVTPTPAVSRRMSELMRLYRSLVKRGYAQQVGRRGVARFLSAYQGGDRSLRAAMRARLPREKALLAVHALTYRR